MMKVAQGQQSDTIVAAEVEHASDQAVRAIPPLWPLASSVAVNPFLGQTAEPLSQTAARLARVGGIRITPSRDYYRKKLADGTITNEDLIAALHSPVGDTLDPLPDLHILRAAVDSESSALVAQPCVAELVARHTGTDWPALLTERFGAWAGGYFDQGQALWAAPRARGAYASWRAEAAHDLTLEIAGLTGFAQHVADAPETATDMRARAVTTLGLTEPALETYFHSLLCRLGGWAQYARYQAWQADLAGTTDSTLTDCLAIALLHEEAMFLHAKENIESDWQAVIAIHAQPLKPDNDLIIDALWQDALERATKRQLVPQLLQHGVNTIGKSASSTSDNASTTPELSAIKAGGQPQLATRPSLQAAFCIDVRSEVFRRALESVEPTITTLGFAGFFGISTAHKRFASDVVEHRLPVLLNAGLHSSTKTNELLEADHNARVLARALRAWRRFKLAAVSSFSFVDATGPLYAFKLLRDSLGLSPQKDVDPQRPQLDPSPDMASRVTAANQVLNAMSLTDGFAPVVLLIGHGATVTNNAHASGMHCGACGGYSGEVNARLLASLLNDVEVRQALSESDGPIIPEDTHFIAGLHDTTGDTVQLFSEDNPLVADESLTQIRDWLKTAGQLARTERAVRLPRADTERAIAARCRDWAEIRPEWALAGCRTFIAAPRSHTRGLDLGGEAFLHEYRWQQDKEFAILELIMTAPVVVASWINLQYYGSLVAPDAFGAGNKLLHNVSGGIGVVEGNGGNLRAGLPWQSVHDGEQSAHQPLRLCVCVEAPKAALNDILERHPQVRELFDNRWLSLISLDSAESLAWHYQEHLTWEAVATHDPVTNKAA